MSLACVLIGLSSLPSFWDRTSSRSFLLSSEIPLLSERLALDGRSWRMASVLIPLSWSIV